MPYGINVYGPGGMLLTDPQLPSAGLFVERIVLNYGQTLSKEYTGVPAGALVVQAVDVGMHDWTIDSINGNARLNFTAYLTSNTLRQVGSTFFVYATRTWEPTYGLMCLNDAGDRLFSTLYPLAEFIGKSAVGVSQIGSDFSMGGYVHRTYRTSSTFTCTPNECMVLLELPDSGQDVWFHYDWFAVSAGVWRIDVLVALPSGVTPTLPPSVMVFKVRNLTSSSETYGVRVFDASGNVTFDAGKRHLVLKELGTGYTTPVNPFTAATSKSFTNLTGSRSVRVPTYRYETWVARSGQAASDYDEYKTFTRRSGSSLTSKFIKIGVGFQDAPVNESYFFGQSYGHVIPIVDPALYPFT
jgi:hypothetical protein